MRVVCVFSMLIIPVLADGAEPRVAIEHFEARVRPILNDYCLSCHGEKKQEAGLRLDSRAGVLKGSDSGPVVIPGDPERSKLIKAILHQGDRKMPKNGAKLPQSAVDALTLWVKLGAPFPEAAGPSANAKADPRRHWAFQPIERVRQPQVKNATSPVDCIILAKLEQKGLAFSPLADKRTLARRAYFDLLGMPPTAKEIEEFAADQSANAFEKLVDRLLGSPHYGEAQARRWLDLARYADTKGYVFQEDRNYPFAYTYRDWVIRAFNEDMPYDRFLMMQIAADRMNPTDKRDLAALGFETLGRRFLNNLSDIIDDRLDVTFRTFLGLTVSCARCHDHKFDPIPTKDYYSLYGVFASSVEPKDLPLIGDLPRTPEVIAFEKQLRTLEDDANSAAEKIFKERLARWRHAESLAAYMLAVHDARGKKGDEVQSIVSQRELNFLVFDRWRTYLNEQKREHSPVFAAWNTLSAVPVAKFSAAAATDALNKLAADAETTRHSVNSLVLKELNGKKLSSMKDVSAIYGKIIAENDSSNSDQDRKEIAAVLGKSGPLDISMENAQRLFNTAERNRIVELRKKADAFKANSPVAPPRAMVLNDAPNLFNPYVFLRGNQNNHGPTVPRQFLEILSGPERKPFTDGSGRLELAKAIADPKNPLTARVMVNRLWIMHFGQGLVRTPSDFGIRTEQPTHPELLDWLATQFIESGWSVKKIHRLIMLSRTYQQVSASSEIVDPENRLLSRMNRRRFDFEALRDGMLLASGQLDRAQGGKPVDIFKEPFSHRRTIYGFIDRQNLPGTFRIFDFASPDTHSPLRFTTTVPQQALFLLNSPFVVEQARRLVARPEISAQQTPVRKVEELYRLVYGRAPDKVETGLALAFIATAEEKVGQAKQETGSAGPKKTTVLTRWEQLAQTLLLSNEFAFVD
jgi:hypothetical protein